jgi:Ankyrin repeats (3 copies)
VILLLAAVGTLTDRCPDCQTGRSQTADSFSLPVLAYPITRLILLAALHIYVIKRPNNITMGACSSANKNAGAAGSDGDRALDSLTNEEKCSQIHNMIVRNNTGLPEMEKFITALKGVEVADAEGIRPLHLAAKNGLFNILDMLIGLKADVHGKDNLGNTPLHYAIGYNRFDCAARLKNAKADDRIPNNDGIPARRGHDGKSSFGMAAMLSASTTKQALIGMHVCF